ncbi:hypothetical protein [Subtercola sp. PAMC28395]|nr:hypothetical protein [Subtercola sp. PAMC28395]
MAPIVSVAADTRPRQGEAVEGFHQSSALSETSALVGAIGLRAVD